MKFVSYCITVDVTSLSGNDVNATSYKSHVSAVLVIYMSSIMVTFHICLSDPFLMKRLRYLCWINHDMCCIILLRRNITLLFLCRKRATISMHNRGLLPAVKPLNATSAAKEFFGKHCDYKDFSFCIMLESKYFFSALWIVTITHGVIGQMQILIHSRFADLCVIRNYPIVFTLKNGASSYHTYLKICSSILLPADASKSLG